jgi:hypothetical protein
MPLMMLMLRLLGGWQIEMLFWQCYLVFLFLLSMIDGGGEASGLEWLLGQCFLS